jgi:hypothetical protein
MEWLAAVPGQQGLELDRFELSDVAECRTHVISRVFFKMRAFDCNKERVPSDVFPLVEFGSPSFHVMMRLFF